jgi:hypothetical protein
MEKHTAIFGGPVTSQFKRITGERKMTSRMVDCPQMFNLNILASIHFDSGQERKL